MIRDSASTPNGGCVDQVKTHEEIEGIKKKVQLTS